MVYIWCNNVNQYDRKLSFTMSKNNSRLHLTYNLLLSIIRNFDYRGIFFSRFYDTDDEILRQNRNLACVIYFCFSPGRGERRGQKTINRRGFYSRKRDIIVNDFDNRRELCGTTAVNRRQMADIDVFSC